MALGNPVHTIVNKNSVSKVSLKIDEAKLKLLPGETLADRLSTTQPKAQI